MVNNPAFEPYLIENWQGNIIPNFKGTMDGIVDINGDLQLFAEVQTGLSTHVDSVIYSYTALPSHLFNFTINDAGVEEIIWCDSIITNKVSDDSPWAYGYYDGVGWTNRLQASRSVDGSAYFALWTDTEDAEEHDYENAEPDLKGWGRSVISGTVDGPIDFTEGTMIEGLFFFHYVSPVAKTVENETTMEFSIGVSQSVSPVEYLTNDNLDPVTHSFVKGINFSIDIGDPFISIDPMSVFVDHNAGSFTVDVSSNINWFVGEACDWVSCDPVSGYGSDSFTVEYSNNYGNPERSCGLTVFNTEMGIYVVLLLVQEEGGDYILLDVNSVEVDYLGGSFEAQVQSNINWTVSESCDWITCTPASGSNNGSFVVSYEENTDTIPRTCTIEVGDGDVSQLLTVMQDGAPFLNVSPLQQNVDFYAGNFWVTVNSNVEWLVDENCDWLYCDPWSGVNNGLFIVYYYANTGMDERSCDVTISGDGLCETLTVNQAAEPAIILDPEEIIVDFNTGNVVVNILSNVEWNILESCDWLSCEPVSGSNNGSFSITYNENTNYDLRTCTITVDSDETSETVTVTQSGTPAISISPTSVNVTYQEGNIDINVISNTEWTVEESCDWLYCQPVNGQNNGEFTVYYEENLGNENRTCIISVNIEGDTKELTLTQDFYDGIENYSLAGDFRIFPNPVNTGYYYIITSETLASKGFDIRVYNPEGHQVEQISNLFGTENQINVSGYNKGIYYLNIISTGGTTVKKLIVL